MLVSDESRVNFASSEKEIIEAYEKLKNESGITLKDWEDKDLIARMLFFLENSDKVKLTASFNRTISDPKNGVSNSAFKRIITIPKNVNNYTDYLSGEFQPVFKIFAYNENKAIQNEIVVSIDFKNKIVCACVLTNKLVIGYDGRVFDKYCVGVCNYVIPNAKGLIRGKIKDLKNNSGKITSLKLNYEDMEAFNDVIAKSVISVCRVDFDARHTNIFEETGFNKEKIKMLEEYFRPCAEAPHFHFVYRDYVISHNKDDSSSLAISSGGLTRYLVDLCSANKNDKLANFDLCMPFLSIKKNLTEIQFSDVKDLTYGLRSTYLNMSKENQEVYKDKFITSITRMFERLSKNHLPEDKIDKFYNQADMLSSYLLGLDMPDQDTMFDPIEVLALQMCAINTLFNLPAQQDKEKIGLGRLATDFFGTVNYCLSKVPKQKQNENENEGEESRVK